MKTHDVIELPPRVTTSEAIEIINDWRATHFSRDHRLMAGTVILDVPVLDDDQRPTGETREVTTKPGDRLGGILFV